MKVRFLIIGGGLSGLAAGIRFARFSPDVLILEKHSRIGGLNSYYYRDRILLETGLHAITNYCTPQQKHAPLNKLFRQLKLPRKDMVFHPQQVSEIHFTGQASLLFSNEFGLLQEEVSRKFPSCREGFARMIKEIDDFNPFVTAPFSSAKKFVLRHLEDELLTDMIMCPLMYYGSSVEDDMDMSQFVIMFRSIYQEGMFRPAGTIKSFLDTISHHYADLGGRLLLNKEVRRICHQGKRVSGVELADGEYVECDYLLSTAGLSETCAMLGLDDPATNATRLGFIESIFLLRNHNAPHCNRTIIFFNEGKRFHYSRPNDLIDLNSGVICLPANFQGRPSQEYFEVRSTHLANYHQWKRISGSADYLAAKAASRLHSRLVLEKIIGKFGQDVIFQDTFTPLTIRRYTAKKDGAIYGSSTKIKDGNIGFSNLFLAGTDQGFLGIVGSMLSGVSMVNQHILPRI